MIFGDNKSPDASMYEELMKALKNIADGANEALRVVEKMSL